MSGCSGIRLRTHCRIRHISLAERNTLEHKTQFCAMGIFRSQTPRALINAACKNYCPAYAFHFGRIRPVFMPVSGLFCSCLGYSWYCFLPEQGQMPLSISKDTDSSIYPGGLWQSCSISSSHCWYCPSFRAIIFSLPPDFWMHCPAGCYGCSSGWGHSAQGSGHRSVCGPYPLGYSVPSM